MTTDLDLEPMGRYRTTTVGGQGLEIGLDTILICAGGFEDRSLAVASDLGSRCEPLTGAIIFRYGPGQDPTPTETLISAISSRCSGPLEVVDVDPDSPTKSVFSIQREIERLVLSTLASKAVVDVTGLTQMFGISALHACVTLGLQVSVYYAEAEEYFPLESEADEVARHAADSGTYDYWELLQSEGLQSVHIHPEFAGALRMDHPTALAVFLGYEPNRVRGLLDEYSPAAVVGLLGVPPHESLSWRTTLSQNLHAPFLARWPSVKREVSTFELDSIERVLEETYSDLGSDYDFGVAPQCSKMQMIATYWFWQAHPEVQLIFTTPISFNKSRYSTGIGSRHLLVREHV